MDIATLIIILAVIVDIILAVQASVVANDKGYDTSLYGWLCFFSGGLGLLLVIALPNQELQQTSEKILLEQQKANELQKKTNELLEKLIGTDSLPASDAPTAETAEDTPPEEYRPFDGSKYWVCPKCKRMNANILDYCSQCGEHKQ